MIQNVRDERDRQNENKNLESDKINSASETKSFLKKIEDDIGFQKARFTSKASFLKCSFKPETMRKFREGGGLPPSNRQVFIKDQLAFH